MSGIDWEAVAAEAEVQKCSDMGALRIMAFELHNELKETRKQIADMTAAHARDVAVAAAVIAERGEIIDMLKTQAGAFRDVIAARDETISRLNALVESMQAKRASVAVPGIGTVNPPLPPPDFMTVPTVHEFAATGGSLIESCSNCRCFKAGGLCQRYPPTVFRSHVPIFPQVPSTGWCGEWERKS